MEKPKTLPEMAKDLMIIEQKKELLNAQLKDLNKEISRLELSIVTKMEEDGLKDFTTPFAKFARKSQPYATITDQDLLVKHLKEIGSYENLVTLTASTANKWYGEQLDRAKENGDLDFAVPGMEMTSSRITLSVTQKKLHALEGAVTE
jgi:hypothetical protein